MLAAGSASGSDFWVSSSPSEIVVAPGDSGSATISVSANRFYSGAVSLTADAPPDSSAKLSPSSVELAASGTATSTLTVTVGLSQLRDFIVRVRGCGDAVCNEANIEVHVAPIAVGSGLPTA